MGKLIWSRKFRTRNQAKISMAKKKKLGYDVSGVYPTPDNRYFFVAEKKKRR